MSFLRTWKPSGPAVSSRDQNPKLQQPKVMVFTVIRIIILFKGMGRREIFEEYPILNPMNNSSIKFTITIKRRCLFSLEERLPPIWGKKPLCHLYITRVTAISQRAIKNLSNNLAIQYAQPSPNEKVPKFDGD